LKNHVIRQNKTPHEELGRHGMEIQKVLKDITSSRNFVSSPKTSLEEENIQKDEEKGKNTLKVEAMRPGVRSSVQKIIFTFLVLTRGARARLEKCFFSASLGKKPSFSTQT
jgi:hypothetical protein